MLFRNKDMTWKSVSDFTLEKCNESLMDSFIEDIDLDEIIPREKEDEANRSIYLSNPESRLRCGW